MFTFSIIYHLFFHRISGVVIKIRLVFVTLGPKPSESQVLQVVNSLLASNLTTKRTVKAVIPSDPVVKTGVTYSSEFFSLLYVLFLCV